MISTIHRDGVNCNGAASNDAITFLTKVEFDYVFLKTNGDCRYYIDELYGRDDGQGWCLSTDPADQDGVWKD